MSEERDTSTPSPGELLADSEALSRANARLDGESPAAIIRWALARAERPMLSTSFGPQSAALLHAVLSVDASVPVLWIDHGFNTDATYRFARQLIEHFEPRMHIVAPRWSQGWLLNQLGGVPAPEEPRHKEFTRIVKLEPFERALDELQPDLWLAGIRRDETAHRRQLSVLSEGRPGLLRTAPFFTASSESMDDYLREHALPSEPDYFDPTKGLAGRECGLHLAAQA